MQPSEEPMMSFLRTAMVLVVAWERSLCGAIYRHSNKRVSRHHHPTFLATSDFSESRYRNI